MQNGISEKKLLKSAGTISAEMAGAKAEAEFLKYRNERDKENISDFDRDTTSRLKRS